MSAAWTDCYLKGRNGIIARQRSLLVHIDSISEFTQTSVHLPFEDDGTLGIALVEIDGAVDARCCFLFGIR